MSEYSITYGKNLLRAIGAPWNPETDKFLRAWAQAEGSLAKFNPFATTQPMPGATNFNSSGVKNYVSWQQGVEATAKTLGYSHYVKFVSAIRAGLSAKQMATLLETTPWGTGGLALEVLTTGAGPREVAFGNCYPVPPAVYAHGDAKIRPGDTGPDVDELLRAIAIKKGTSGYKYYSGDAINYVKRWQLLRFKLFTPGQVGQTSYTGITGHA